MPYFVPAWALSTIGTNTIVLPRKMVSTACHQLMPSVMSEEASMYVGTHALIEIQRAAMSLVAHLRSARVVGARSSLEKSLTIGSVSYKIAGENMWQFILFIGMISVNLAVINFLPIPVLDGGHMVFLIYEKIRGKPAPESVMLIALYIGLAAILLLMCFVLYLDISRMFF